MNGKLKLVRNGQTDKTDTLLNVIMTEEEKNYFVAGCDAIDDGFSRQLKDRLGSYEPEDEEDDELAREGPLFNFLIKDEEVFECLLTLFGYIAVYGVDEIHAGDYSGIIDALKKEVGRLKEEVRRLREDERTVNMAQINHAKKCLS